MRKIADFIARWMGELVLLTAVVTMLWPSPFLRVGTWVISTLMITAVVAIVVSHNASKLLTGGLVVVLVVVLHNLSGLGTGYLMGRILGMSEAKRKAISIEVGMQNSGLATSLAALHFAAYPMATIPGAVFSVWHNISGALVARLFTARKETQT